MAKAVHVRRHARGSKTTYLSRRAELPATLHRKTTTGVPVRIEIGESVIYAYREDEAQVIKREFGKDSTAFSIEPTLSRYLTEASVMEIRKLSGGDFEVDFQAGFQRGRITVGPDELVKRSFFPEPGPGYLKWIGLRATDPEVQEFLKA